MLRGWRRTLGAAVVAAAVVAGGSVALAATQQTAPQNGVQSFLDDVASHLGVQPSALLSAVQAAELDRVDQALSSGRITQQQASTLKQRIQAGKVGVFGLRPFGFRHFGRGLPLMALKPVAAFLGLTPQQLRTDLRSGQSLAQIATSQGKSVGGLEQAILAQVKTRLDQAVQSGRLTSAQEQTRLDRIQKRVDQMVQHARHRPRTASPPTSSSTSATGA